MKLSTSDLKTDRHWRSATGLDKSRFLKLLALLPAAYQQMYGLSIQQRQAECPQQPTLSTYEDLLLFTLFSLKSNLSFDLLGFTTGMDGSTAKRNQTIGLPVIEAALLGSGHAPKQPFESVDDFKAYFAPKGTILIDATEQRTQRPVDGDYQKDLNSGKKKRLPSRP
ncbi:MAG: transposase family protein [Cytophagaceae bacterium]|nr:transposase family protein [Cytophagaceae bacterium]